MDTKDEELDTVLLEENVFAGDVAVVDGLVDLDDAESASAHNGDEEDGSRSHGDYTDADATASGSTHDVVEVDVTEDEDASHHASLLVEGDFFPTEAPADVEAQLTSADPEAEEELKALEMEASPSVVPPSGTTSQHTALAADGGAPARRRRRVQWADSVVVNHTEHRRPLIKHVTSFYMPQNARRTNDQLSAGGMGGRHLHGFGGGLGSSAAVDSALFPEPVAAPTAAAVALFKERQNTNGEPYLFCRAQRVAPYFVEWKRDTHQPFDVPFARQPGTENDQASAPEPPRPQTLFAALYPPTNSVATPSSMRAYVVTMNIHNNFQMPFMRPDQVFDEPFMFAQ